MALIQQVSDTVHSHHIYFPDHTSIQKIISKANIPPRMQSLSLRPKIELNEKRKIYVCIQYTFSFNPAELWVIYQSV